MSCVNFFISKCTIMRLSAHPGAGKGRKKGQGQNISAGKEREGGGTLHLTVHTPTYKILHA